MNKWFNKQIVLSFILGGILFSSAGVFATTQLNILPNTYPIIVNDNKVDLEAYNIEGRTYLQLRDTTKILDADLDFKNNTIYINTSETNIANNTETTPTPELTPTSVEINIKDESEVDEVESQTSIFELRQNKPKSTPDGITDIDIYDGKYYVAIVYIQNSINTKGYNIIKDVDNLKILKDDQIIIENIQSKFLSGFGNEAIEYNYYINEILPLIK